MPPVERCRTGKEKVSVKIQCSHERHTGHATGVVTSVSPTRSISLVKRPVTLRASSHWNDTEGMHQATCCRCFCGLPQYFAHTNNSAQVTVAQRLIKSLTRTISAFSQTQAVANCPIAVFEVHVLDDLLALMQVNIRKLHAICHYVRLHRLLSALGLAETVPHTAQNRTSPVLSECIACGCATTKQHSIHFELAHMKIPQNLLVSQLCVTVWHNAECVLTLVWHNAECALTLR